MAETEKAKPKPDFRFAARSLVQLAIVLHLALVFSACSLDYGNALPEDLADTIPDTVVYNFRHTVVRNGSIRFVLTAERAETWEKAGRITMKNVQFTEYSTKSAGGGEIVASGMADQATFYIESENAELQGNVFFSAPDNDVTVRTGNLSWDGKERTLASQLDTITTLTSGDSSISGAGFSANARNRSFSFRETVVGRFAASDTQE